MAVRNGGVVKLACSVWEFDQRWRHAMGKAFPFGILGKEITRISLAVTA